MIRRLNKGAKVYLSTRTTDMRKSINGLAAIVQGSFQLDPFNGALFVFCNNNHDKLKVLQWDKDGFVLYYKKRERGRFQWPSKIDSETGTVNITRDDLNRLLEGLVMEQFVPRKTFYTY